MKSCLKSGSAFSLVEIAITTTVVGIIASLALVGIGQVVESTNKEKLSSDVETLNRGVLAYRASGGDLSNLDDPNEVLNALKQSSSKRAPGLTGSKIDPRIVFVYQTDNEASSGSSRVYWDSATQRFKISNSGDSPGIKGFELNAEAGEIDYGSSDGNHSLLYAEEDDWIWDYQEVARTTPDGPSDFAVTPVPNNSTPSIPSTSLPPATPSSKLPLAPPVFSIPSSSLPYPSFDLSLFLTDPNPPGVSEIYYSIDYGNWMPYTGSVTVPPDANVAAQAVAVSTKYSNSPRVDHAYEALPVSLIPPVISPSRTSLGVFAQRTSRVFIVNPNDTSVSEIEYQLNSGGWQPYNHPFVINRNFFPNGVTILARVVPKSNPHYSPSNSTTSTIIAESVAITGDATGSFHDPVGGTDLVSNLTNSTTGGFFEWGLADTSDRSSSTLEYTATSFSAPTIGDSFVVGTLDYYNGTIASGTGADRISLSVDLNLMLNGKSAVSTFDFDFDLINVANQNDPNNPWQDADYVKLPTPVANEVIVIDGVEFTLKLEFGETSQNGIALFDEFYVLEERTAKTSLFGTLVEVGSIIDEPEEEEDGGGLLDVVVDTVDTLAGIGN